LREIERYEVTLALNAGKNVGRNLLLVS